jgi:hypothetical protein
LTLVREVKSFSRELCFGSGSGQLVVCKQIWMKYFTHEDVIPDATQEWLSGYVNDCGQTEQKVNVSDVVVETLNK